MSSGSFLLPFFFESLLVSFGSFVSFVVSFVSFVSLSRGAGKAPAGANRRAESTRLIEDRRKEKRRIMTPLPRHVSNGPQQSPTELACTQYRTKITTPGGH